MELGGSRRDQATNHIVRAAGGPVPRSRGKGHPGGSTQMWPGSGDQAEEIPVFPGPQQGALGELGDGAVDREEQELMPQRPGMERGVQEAKTEADPHERVEGIVEPRQEASSGRDGRGCSCPRKCPGPTARRASRRCGGIELDLILRVPHEDKQGGVDEQDRPVLGEPITRAERHWVMMDEPPGGSAASGKLASAMKGTA